jgi:hypothetical protein
MFRKIKLIAIGIVLLVPGIIIGILGGIAIIVMIILGLIQRVRGGELN